MNNQMINPCECGCMTTDGSNIWYLTYLGGTIIELNNMTGEIEYIATIPDTDKDTLLYRTIIYHDYSIYILPYYTDKLWRYDIESKCFTIIESSLLNDLFNGKAEIYGCILLQDDIYMYGLKNFILKYNTKKNEFHYWNINEISSLSEPFFWKNGFSVNEKILVPLVKKEAMIIVSDNHIEHISWSNKEDWYSTIVLPYNDRICFVGVSEEGDFEVKLFNDDDKKSSTTLCKMRCKNRFGFNGEAPFSEGIIYNNKLILMPGCQPYGYVISLFDGSVMDFLLDSITRSTKDVYIFCGINIGECFTCIDWKSSSVISINLDDMRICEKKLWANKEIYKQLYDDGGSCVENAIMSLGGYIDYLKNY